MARKYFGTDGVRGKVGTLSDHARFCVKTRLGGR